MAPVVHTGLHSCSQRRVPCGAGRGTWDRLRTQNRFPALRLPLCSRPQARHGSLGGNGTLAGFSAMGGRAPPLVLAALLVLVAVLAFNCWSGSSRAALLQEELAELQGQAQRGEAARGRLERRNAELLGRLEAQRKQLEQKEAECGQLGGQLHARDGQARRCEETKIKLQNNISYQMADIHRLKEQLAELRQEFIRQEDQLHEYKKNNTYLMKRLEYDSLQCGQQIKEMRLQHEENMKKLMDQVIREQKATQKIQPSKGTEVSPNDEDPAVSKTVPETEDKNTVEIEEPSDHAVDGKEKIKLGGDAGMPEIEDNGPAKAEDTPTASQNEGRQPVMNLPTEQPQAPNLAPGLHPDSDGNADTVKQIPPNSLQHLTFEENTENQKEHKIKTDHVKLPKSRVSDLQKMKQSKLINNIFFIS
uniref:Protein GOLM2 n=1 Tax=Nothoprocta perdicaria TaxID=30464 RepID=A0A8C6ZFC7_NOTPE